MTSPSKAQAIHTALGIVSEKLSNAKDIAVSVQELKPIFLEFPFLMAIPLESFEVECCPVEGYLLAHSWNCFTPQEQQGFTSLFTEDDWSDFCARHLSQILLEPALAGWVTTHWNKETLGAYIEKSDLLVTQWPRISSHPEFLSNSGLTLMLKEAVISTDFVAEEMLQYISKTLSEVAYKKIQQHETRIRPEPQPLRERPVDTPSFELKLNEAHLIHLAQILSELSDLVEKDMSFEQICADFPNETQSVLPLVDYFLAQATYQELEELSTNFFRLQEEKAGRGGTTWGRHVGELLHRHLQAHNMRTLVLDSAACAAPQTPARSRLRI